MPERQARELALRVAEMLATAGAMPAAGDIPAVKIDLTAEIGSDPLELAERITEEVIRQLRRAP